MKIRPISLSTKSSSSTAVVAEFLSEALKTQVEASTLRKTYQLHFQTLLNLEREPLEIGHIETVLNRFQQSFVTADNQTIVQAFHTTSPMDMSFLVIQGSQNQRFIDFGDEPRKWVEQGIAEPGIIDVLSKKRAPLSTLLALAAGAECAPTHAWLEAGGTVLAIMRPNPQRWLELIEFTRATAGQLIIPLKGFVSETITDTEIAAQAGIDLVEDFEYLPTVLKYSLNQRHVVIGAYAYSPGASHIVVQAVQDAFIEFASTKFSEQHLAFHWLATPTDSQLLPPDFHKYSMARYKNRSIGIKIRDLLWTLLGQLRAPKETLQGNVAVVDSSVQKQGFNYQFSKRMQRLRAHVLHSKGFCVAYGVTPPATTDSVLRHRILIASYRGAPRFGLHPFDKDLVGPIAMQQCLHALSQKFSQSHEIYSKFAVHGGLWRLGYDPQTVWIPATLSGFFALLLPRNRAFRSISLTKR